VEIEVEVEKWKGNERWQATSEEQGEEKREGELEKLRDKPVNSTDTDGD
jgi:hypothetical protein